MEERQVPFGRTQAENVYSTVYSLRPKEREKKNTDNKAQREPEKTIWILY